jgi:hypothetical protein
MRVVIPSALGLRFLNHRIANPGMVYYSSSKSDATMDSVA